MVKLSVIFIFLLIFILIPFSSSANDFSYNRLYSNTEPTDRLNDLDDVSIETPLELQLLLYNESSGLWYNSFLNNSIHSVNASNYWITDIGSLGTVNATQFSNQGGTLNVIEGWVDSLWCRLSGCTMNGDIDMGGFDIFNVNNITANNFIGNNSFWINDSGIINTTTLANYFFQGNVSLFDLEIRNPASIRFILPNNESAVIFANTIEYINKTRNGLSVDADFGVFKNYDGTSIIGGLNINTNENSSSLVTVNTFLGHGMGIIKFNPNYRDPEVGWLINNFGNTKFLMLDNETNNSFSFAFYDEIIRDIATNDGISVTGVANETTVMVINTTDINMSVPLTVQTNITATDTGFFEFIGSITNRVTKIWASALDVEGDINQSVGDAFINNIYGYAKMKNETGVVIDLVSVGIFENITGINNGSVVNGVTYDGDHAFTINHSGTYEISASVSFAGSSATEYFFDFIVNNVEQDIFAIRQITTSNAEGSVSLGPYAINLNPGDIVTLGVADGATPVDPTMIGVQFGIRRIGQ